MRALGNPLSEIHGRRGVGVHRVAAGDEGNDTARSYGFERLGEKVVMDTAGEKRLAFERRIVNAEVSEWNVRDRTVEVVLGQFRIFEGGYVYPRVRVEQLGNLAGGWVLVEPDAARSR